MAGSGWMDSLYEIGVTLMSFLPFAGTSINLVTIFLAGLTIGIAGGVFGSLANLVIVPALSLFGLPLSFSVSSSTGLNLCQTSMSAFSGSDRSAFRRVGLVAGLIGLPGVLLGFKFHLFMAQTETGVLMIRLFYIATLLAWAIILFRQWYFFNQNDYYDDAPFPSFGLNWKIPIAIPGGSGLNHITLLRVAIVGFPLGVATGLLGFGAGVLGIPLFMYILGLPPKNAAATDAIAMTVTGLGALLCFSLTGYVESAVLLILILAVTLGNHIGKILPGEPNLSHARLAFSTALIITALSAAVGQFSMSLAQVIISATGITLCLFLVVSSLVPYKEKGAAHRKNPV